MVKGKKGGEQVDEAEEEIKRMQELKRQQMMKPMRRGDYRVQVHIIEARDLQPRDIGDMNDPVCRVTVMEQKQYTKIHSKCLSCEFDEVLYFEFRDKEVAEIKQGKVLVEVMDANTFTANQLVGLYQLDLTRIYYREHHEMHQQWVGLYDPVGTYEGVQGFLKISITVLGPEDEQHTFKDDDDGNDSMMAVLLPPQVQTVMNLLKFRVYEARNLIRMDEWPSITSYCDPYVKIEFAGSSLNTKVKKGMNPEWNATLAMPVSEPILSDVIKISVYDSDSLSDELIGVFFLSYNDVKNQLVDKEGFGQSRWYNLYGAPRAHQDGTAHKMNAGIIPGSHFRGKVLISSGFGMGSKSKDHPRRIESSCPKIKLRERPKATKYLVQMDLYEGSEMGEEDKDLHIELCVGTHVQKSKKVKSKHGRCKWYDVLEDMVVTYPLDTEEVPDIFVYLTRGRDRICFKRFRMEALIRQGWKVPPAWIVFQEDTALDKLSAEECPGSILASLRAGFLDHAPPEVEPESRPLKQIMDRLMEPSPTSSPDLTRDTLSSRSPSMNSTISSDIVNCVTKISLQHIDVTVDGVPATEASAIGNGATIASDEATANGAHYDNVNVNASASIDETSFAVKGDCDMSLNAATNVSADAGACGPPFSSAPLLTPSLSSPATALASVPEGAKEQSGGTESKEQNDTGGDGDDCSENTDNINTIIERDGGGNTIGQKKAVKLQRAMTWTDGGVSPVIDFQQSSDISNAHSTDRSGNATTNKERRTRTKRTQTISPHMEASVKEEEFMGRAMLDFGKSQEDVKLDSISTTGVMKVKIHSAKNLPAMDRSGLSDPYVLCSVNDDTRKTRVIKSTLNPFWDDEDISHQSHNVDERKGGNDSKISNENKNKKFSRGSEFTFHNVSITDTMHVMVMDWDMLLQDDHIGSFTVDLRSLNMTSGFPMGTSFKKKQWFLLENLPNSSLHLTVEFEYHTLAHSKKVARKLRRRAKRKKRMLRNTVDSMFGSGRENVLPLGSKILGYPSQGQYQLRGRVYLGRNLPACDSSGTSDPFLEMHCCGHSDKTSHKNDTVDPTWNEVLSFNIHTLPEPITMAPYIQVFAYDFDRFSSKDPLGRFKVSCEEARDNYLDYRERCMRKRAKVLEDRRTGGKWERDHDEHSGLPSNLTSPLSSLATKITHTNGTIEQPGASSSSAARDGTRVNEAANISNGSANTTDTINNDHSSHDIANSTGSTNRHTTEVLVRTQEFIETHELQLAHKGLEGEHTHTDDEMEFDDELFAEIKPRWYQLYDWHNNIIEGAKILADFQLLTSEEVQEDSVVEDITPVTMPVNLEVLSLGCRNLSSPSGVHKTYVELTLPDGTSFRTDASSHPHPKDPNFLQLLKIPLDIPIERIFAPCINVRIIDTFFGGLVKRTLGASSIDLANFLEEDPQTGLLRAKTQNTTMVAGEVMNDEEKVHKLQSLQDNIAHAKDMEKGRKEREHRRKEKRKQRGHYDAHDLREGLRNRKMKEDQGKHDNHLLGGEKCVTKLRNKDKHNVDNTERKKEEGDINVDINIGAGGGGGGDGGDGNAKKQKHRMVGDNGMDVEMDIFSTKGEGGGEISDDGHGNGNRRGCNGDGSDSDDDGVGIGVFDSRKKDDCTGTDAEKKTSKSGIGFKNGVLKRRGNIGDGHIKLTSSEKPGKSRGKGSGGGEDKGAIKDGEDDDDSADESHPLLEDDRDVRISIEEEFVSNIERYDPSETMSLEEKAAAIEDEIPYYMRGRVTVDDELEDFMIMQPFQTFLLHTGQMNANLLQTKYREAGMFKGLLYISSRSDDHRDDNDNEDRKSARKRRQRRRRRIVKKLGASVVKGTSKLLKGTGKVIAAGGSGLIKGLAQLGHLDEVFATKKEVKKGHRGSEGEKQKLVPEGVSATEGDGSEKKKELVHFPDKHDEQQTEPKEKERGKRAKEAKKKEITQKKSLSRLVEDKNRKVVLARFKQALTVKSVYLRVYVLRGIGLTPHDFGNTSDPYLVLKVSGRVIASTRGQYKPSTNDPEFFVGFECPVQFPGDSTLEVEVWDYDGIGDDLIGSTSIDIENRYFSNEWKAIDQKPLERRTLHCPNSRAPQGKLEMWVDILKSSMAKRNPILDIRPPAPMEYEIRVVVWGVRDVTIKDTVTDQNDVFVTCSGNFPSGSKRQTTDTHYRSKNGLANFNWRMKFPVTLPMPHEGRSSGATKWPRLRFQVWDFDFFSFDDSIAECVLSLKGLCQRVMKTQKRIQLYNKKGKKGEKDRIWIKNLRHPKFKGNQGRLQVSIEILPKHMADLDYPAGFGRSDPNMNSFLPEPAGRVIWSLYRPLDMLRELIGNKMYYKLCCCLFCFFFTFVLLLMGPSLISAMIANSLDD